jgi:hypothetical protein
VKVLLDGVADEFASALGEVVALLPEEA